MPALRKHEWVLTLDGTRGTIPAWADQNGHRGNRLGPEPRRVAPLTIRRAAALLPEMAPAIVPGTGFSP
jgi:hypothetical protein